MNRNKRSGITILLIIMAGALLGLLILIPMHLFLGEKNDTTETKEKITIIDLLPGLKLETISWRDTSDLWIQTRKRRSGEEPEEHYFDYKLSTGILGAMGRKRYIIREQ
jgi:hypothetical protein